VRPISKRFLNDTGTYKPVTGKDAYGKPTFGTSVTISHFHAELPKKTLVQALGDQAEDRLIIYFDCLASRPRSLSFVKGDVVVYEGEDYIIREAQLFPTPAKPHHWEVRLA